MYLLLTSSKLKGIQTDGGLKDEKGLRSTGRNKSLVLYRKGPVPGEFMVRSKGVSESRSVGW